MFSRSSSSSLSILSTLLSRSLNVSRLRRIVSTAPKLRCTCDTRLMLAKSLIMFCDSEHSLSILIISSLIACTVFCPSLRPVIPDCVVSSCSRRPLRSCASMPPFLRENSSFSTGIFSRSSACRSSSASFGAGASSMATVYVQNRPWSNCVVVLRSWVSAPPGYTMVWPCTVPCLGGAASTASTILRLRIVSVFLFAQGTLPFRRWQSSEERRCAFRQVVSRELQGSGLIGVGAAATLRFVHLKSGPKWPQHL
jgi:hypothetical protein